MGKSVLEQRTPTSRGDVSGEGVQLFGTANRMEMFYLSLHRVSTHDNNIILLENRKRTKRRVVQTLAKSSGNAINY